MPGQAQTAPFIDGLYRKLVEGGIGYFFPSAKFDLLEPDPDAGDQRIMQTSGGSSLGPELARIQVFPHAG